MQTYHVMDEFGNEGTLTAETPADAVASWSKSYEQNPLIHHVQVQAHTYSCGGTCWERLEQIGPGCLATKVHLDPGPPPGPPPRPPATDSQTLQSYTLQWNLPTITTQQVSDTLARTTGAQDTSAPAWRTSPGQTEGPLHSTAPCSWPTRGQDMAHLSTLHPQATFTLECEGPADHDRHREYHHQGLMQTAQGRWTYDPPDPTGFAPPPGPSPAPS